MPARDHPDAGSRRADTRASSSRRTVRQLRREWHDNGPRGVLARSLRAVSDRLVPAVDEIGIDPADVAAAIAAPTPLTVRTGRAPATGHLRIGWIVGAPSAGSGGHTTLFRLVRDLEARGHTSVIGIHDRFCPGDVATSRSVIEDHFPPMDADIVDARTLQPSADGPFDVMIATSWATAYVLRGLGPAVPCAYLVQDYEPWFTAPGSATALAEATYRFGFHGICAGGWLPGHLRAQHGMECDHFDFGVDTATYGNHDNVERHAVVFYARPCTPRRGYGLGLLALTRLAEQRPDIDIHLFGEDLHHARLPFRCHDHGAITPAAMDDLFNRCAAGLVLSFTNLSLVPYEMLATGCTPVINDAVHNRALLDNPWVRYTEPTPEALADALAAAVDAPSRRDDARHAAASVERLDWDDAAGRVETALLALTGRGAGRRDTIAASGAGS